METTQTSNSTCTKPDIPATEVEEMDRVYSYRCSSDSKCSKSPTSSVGMKKRANFHSHFLRKLSQNKVWNVNCNRVLLTGPKMTVYWSDYLTKINDIFPNVIQACHINKVSFDEVSVKRL